MAYTNFTGPVTEEKIRHLIFPICPPEMFSSVHDRFNQIKMQLGHAPCKIQSYCLGHTPKQMWVAETYYKGFDIQGQGSTKVEAEVNVKFQFLRAFIDQDAWIKTARADALGHGTLNVNRTLNLFDNYKLSVEVYYATYIYLSAGNLYYMTAAGSSAEMALLFLRSLLSA
ncbi:hypothetical protein [Beihai hepe-like virus 9]|uniref:hypothetical protein n=1 Tax=Beihai hepe-like virus 9 TaxID=1922386 RepID=UPI000909DB4E|nr:hypothetical protein [Beihai hepe-like virus 9]APG77631.1 hypothetical protein [Beihai hepe-like virus 9]